VKAYGNSTKIAVTRWDKPNRSLFREVLVLTHEHNVVLHNRKESTRRHGGQRHPSNDSEQAARNCEETFVPTVVLHRLLPGRNGIAASIS